MNNESKYELVLNSLAMELECTLVNEECLYKLNKIDFNRVIDKVKDLMIVQSAMDEDAKYIVVYPSSYEDYAVVHIVKCSEGNTILFNLSSNEHFIYLLGQSKYDALLKERLSYVDYDINMVEVKESLHHYINKLKLLADKNLFVPVPVILENANDSYTFELYNFIQEFLTKSQALELYLYTLEKLESLYEMERNKLRDIDIMSSFINIKEYLFDEDSAEILDLVYKQYYKYNGVK